MRPLATRFLVTACVVALCGCSDATDSSSGDGTPVVRMVEHNVTLSVGDSATLSLLPQLPPGLVPSDVRWSSSNSAVVSVRRVSSLRAVATSVRAGRAVVHAHADGLGDSAVIVVQ
jgi:hypothetical protein